MMMALLIPVFLLVGWSDTVAAVLPEVECNVTAALPLLWEIHIEPKTLPANEGTSIPDDRKECWKKIPQAQPYPPRERGGDWYEPPYETENLLHPGNTKEQIVLDNCAANVDCVMNWYNSAYKNGTGFMSSYVKFIPQKIKMGGEVPEKDYMRVKMYLTDADCALSIQELAAKNLTQWYPEGGYFRIVPDGDGMLKYEGTGEIYRGFNFDNVIVSY